MKNFFLIFKSIETIKMKKTPDCKGFLCVLNSDHHKRNKI